MPPRAPVQPFPAIFCAVLGAIRGRYSVPNLLQYLPGRVVGSVGEGQDARHGGANLPACSITQKGSALNACAAVRERVEPRKHPTEVLESLPSDDEDCLLHQRLPIVQVPVERGLRRPLRERRQDGGTLPPAP